MLKIDKLKKQYKNFTLNCSMEVKEGMITGFVGPNGSGKSTTLKAVLGLIYIDGGDIQIFGKNVKDIKPEDKEQISVVLSDSGFSRYLTVKDIKDILKNTYEAFDEQLFTNYIEKYQLPTDKKLEQFSVGMKAKLKLITAICHKAKLLILDEPTAGLDVMARNEMLDMLRDYMEEDEERSILVSSHISTDLETLCDNIYMINEGNIILHEETDRLLSNYAILKVDEEQSKTLDPQYIIKMKKESYGYACLTDQKQFYLEKLSKDRGRKRNDRSDHYINDTGGVEDERIMDKRHQINLITTKKSGSDLASCSRNLNRYGSNIICNYLYVCDYNHDSNQYDQLRYI